MIDSYKRCHFVSFDDLESNLPMNFSINFTQGTIKDTGEPLTILTDSMTASHALLF